MDQKLIYTGKEDSYTEDWTQEHRIFSKVLMCWGLFLYLYIEILGLHVWHTSSPLHIG